MHRLFDTETIVTDDEFSNKYDYVRIPRTRNDFITPELHTRINIFTVGTARLYVC